MVKRFALLLFLVTIIDPYASLDYENVNVYYINEEPPYQIKVYGPELDENETEYTDAEIDRFIQKATSIINYSPFVFEQ